jgi:hypothetical protein
MRRRGFGDVSLAPVGIDIPDVSDIPGLNDPSGVSTDNSGMSVVTVTGSQGLPWWGWLAIIGGAIYFFNRR